MSDYKEQYINAHSKSMVAGFLLTLFFGPLGLFYSSWVAALILCTTFFIAAPTVIIPILCWVIAMLISFFAVRSHNKKVRATANLNSEQSST